MSNLIPQLIRKVTPEFQQIVDHYHDVGMQIVPIDGIGGPEQLKAVLGLSKEDFGVCAFMGSRAPKGMAGLSEVVRLYPRWLAKLDKQYDLLMPRISGGGNWDAGAPEEAGLMGQWSRGATEACLPARFVTMQSLAQVEGLPFSPGYAACLKQLPDEDRIGERTDGLICVGDLFVVFPGGLGTLTELAALFTNTSINKDFERKKVIIVDPIFDDPITGETSRFWADDMASLIKKNHAGFIGNETAKNINSHCVLYRPEAGLGPKQMCRELISLTLAVRSIAPKFDTDSGLAALNPALRRKHMLPLQKGSKVERIFNDHGTNGRWVDDLRALVKQPACLPVLSPR